MNELVYPAIFYKDDEKGTNTGWYSALIPDLGIAVEAENVVAAYKRCKAELCATIDMAIKLDCEVSDPSDFEEIYKKNKKNIVLLVDALA